MRNVVTALHDDGRIVGKERQFGADSFRQPAWQLSSVRLGPRRSLLDEGVQLDNGSTIPLDAHDGLFRTASTSATPEYPAAAARRVDVPSLSAFLILILWRCKRRDRNGARRVFDCSTPSGRERCCTYADWEADGLQDICDEVLVPGAHDRAPPTLVALVGIYPGAKDDGRSSESARPRIFTDNGRSQEPLNSNAALFCRLRPNNPIDPTLPSFRQTFSCAILPVTANALNSRTQPPRSVRSLPQRPGD